MGFRIKRGLLMGLGWCAHPSPPDTTVNPPDRRMARQFRIHQVKGGKPVALTGWFEMPLIFPPEYEASFPGRKAFK